MESHINKSRIEHIYNLLLKMAEGDFSFEIERTDEDDSIEAILVLVNLMVEEMKETLRYYHVLNTSDTILQYVNMLFVLDSSFKIQYANSQVKENLGMPETDLINTSFSSILSNKSHQTWSNLAQNMLYQTEFHNITKLTYLCPNKLSKTFTTAINVVPMKAEEGPIIIITTFETVLKSQLIEDGLKKQLKTKTIQNTPKSKKPNVLVNEKDIQIIQQIKAYMMQNIEDPLPNLRTLANQFGTNEYKLKYGFKQLYGNTVFRYLTNKRLKRASLLIQNTSLPIKTIAKMTGFKNVSHFSKTFKDHFGIKPIDLKKFKNPE